MVEFAVVTPLLFLVIFGIFEFGRAIMVRQTLVAAARDGCRLAILDGTTTQDVTDSVAPLLSAAGISVYTVTVNPDPPSGAAQWDPVTVTVETNFDDVSWLPVPTASSRGSWRWVGRNNGNQYLGFCCQYVIDYFPLGDVPKKVRGATP